MATSISECVAAGAAVLDKRDPGWWRADAGRAIDLDRLDFRYGAYSVLGQLCPVELLTAYIGGPPQFGESDYAYGHLALASQLSGLSGAVLTDQPALYAWQVAHGFDGRGRDAVLTAEWRRVVAERREHAGTLAGAAEVLAAHGVTGEREQVAGDGRVPDVPPAGAGAGHAFTPWKFDTENAPARWARQCVTCAPEQGHREISASPLPPAGALAEMEPWERDLLSENTETEWVAVAVARRARPRAGSLARARHRGRGVPG